MNLINANIDSTLVKFGESSADQLIHTDVRYQLQMWNKQINSYETLTSLV